MKENYSRCDICNLLVQYFKILFTEFGNSEANSDAKMATLLEMKCYYWLIKAYSDEFLKDCDCDYSKGLRNIQKSLKAIFIKEKRGIIRMCEQVAASGNTLILYSA